MFYSRNVNTIKMSKFFFLLKIFSILTIFFILMILHMTVQVIRELSGVILTRGPKLCNFVEWRGLKVVYKRYPSFTYI